MNFYIGNSINEINEQDTNVEVSDELIEFIYKLENQVPLDISRLYELDPYADVVISQNAVLQIMEICKYIIDESLLQKYAESEEGYRMLTSLMEISQTAISRDLGLISIGD